MSVVLCINLDEHIVLTGGDVTFNDFGDFFQSFNDLVELRRVFKKETDVGASVVAYC